jgi:hypothetical protein
MHPEEFALVLNVGVHIVEKARDTQYTQRIDELKAHIERLQAEINHRSHEDLREHLTNEVHDALHNLLPTFITQVQSISNAALTQDRKHREEVTQHISNKEETITRRTEDISTQIDRLTETIARLERGKNIVHQLPPPNSKGLINEREMHRLITMAFGHCPNFMIHPKKDYSGDHIFDWNGLRIIWEDKDYSRSVDRNEVEKAQRDLTANNDCHVLILVSANSSICGHETPTGLNIEIYKGRLIIYISHFRSSPDPQGYLRTIVQPILIALKQPLLANSFGTPQHHTSLDIVLKCLHPLIQSLTEQEKSCDSILHHNKVHLNTLKHMISRTKHSIELLIHDTLTPTQHHCPTNTPTDTPLTPELLHNTPTTHHNEQSPKQPNSDGHYNNEPEYNDSSSHDTDNDEPNNTPAEKHKVLRLCGLCRQAGHKANRCPNRQDAAVGSCHKCGMVGHTSRGCKTVKKVRRGNNK